jgi:hypothetical protein
VRRAGATAVVLVLVVAATSCDEESSAPAGAGGAAPPAPYTLDDVCERAMPRVCAAREACCDAIGVAFEPAGCIEEQRRRCDDNVAAARRGELVFEPAHIDACIEDIERLNQRCFLSPIERIFEAVDAYAICDFFRGDVAQGEQCTLSAECAPPSGHGAAACGDTSGVCEHVLIVDEGETCAAGRYCMPGLYCNAEEGAEMGTCRTALGAGDACQLDAPLACGNGRYCDPTSLTCTSTKIGGQACAGNVECTSLACLDNECVPELPIVDAMLCGG